MGEKARMLAREIQSASFNSIEETVREYVERVLGWGGSQFFICTGDVVVMKRNETAATMAGPLSVNSSAME